jgi:Mg-chelatase subunit ChlD
VAKAWCFGDLTLNQVPDDAKTGPDVRNSGLLCDGEALNNATQTDVLTADINFYVEQARNNENFVCTGERPTPTTGPTFTPTPTQTACIDDADVMLVLDRSGSISNTELASLKTAANDFVTALNPGVAGAHVGQSSFATLASLDLHLSDNASTIQAAINALDNGGFTNLVGGLQLASTELDDVGGDGHDRADATSPDYYVVVTDGNPNRPLPEANARTLAANEAAAIAAGGGTVFVVGVGSDVDATYLRDEIASAPANYFSVADYSQLQTALGQIVTTCNGTVN